MYDMAHLYQIPSVRMLDTPLWQWCRWANGQASRAADTDATTNDRLLPEATYNISN